jgi:hypothetical protein
LTTAIAADHDHHHAGAEVHLHDKTTQKMT